MFLGRASFFANSAKPQRSQRVEGLKLAAITQIFNRKDRGENQWLPSVEQASLESSTTTFGLRTRTCSLSRRTAEGGCLHMFGLALPRLRFLQHVQLRKNFGAMLERIDAGVGFRNLSAGVNQERMPRGKLHQAEIG